MLSISFIEVCHSLLVLSFFAELKILQVDAPRAYVCADSKIYDATEWYICQVINFPPDKLSGSLSGLFKLNQ